MKRMRIVIPMSWSGRESVAGSRSWYWSTFEMSRSMCWSKSWSWCGSGSRSWSWSGSFKFRRNR